MLSVLMHPKALELLYVDVSVNMYVFSQSPHQCFHSAWYTLPFCPSSSLHTLSPCLPLTEDLESHFLEKLQVDENVQKLQLVPPSDGFTPQSHLFLSFFSWDGLPLLLLPSSLHLLSTSSSCLCHHPCFVLHCIGSSHDKRALQRPSLSVPHRPPSAPTLTGALH